MRITDLELEERPRERLLNEGAAALSDEELMAIFLRVGVTGMSAIELARAVLVHFGSLAAVFNASPEALCEVKGMGLAKYAQLQAVQEMAKRILASQCRSHSILASRETAYDYVRHYYAADTCEVFRALWLDGGCGLITSEILAQGTACSVSLSTRMVIQRALSHEATGVILVHNHLSENYSASDEDVALTKTLRVALEWIGVTLHDHWIVTRQGVFPIEMDNS